MEDWKERLRELSFMKGYYFRMEDNGLVEKKVAIGLNTTPCVSTQVS